MITRHGHRLTIRQPDEILAMDFSSSDFLLQNGYLAKGDSTSILGAGGLGKSRLVMQLAVCNIVSRAFVDTWQMQGGGCRWLFLQTENSNRRLKEDLARFKSWVGADWPKVQDNLFIHCLENEADGFTYLNNPLACDQIRERIIETKPDVVVWDALKDFQTGNLNEDVQMQATLSEISRLTRAGNPQRVPLVVHHAGTGKAGAAKAIGYDRNSFGRNSKVLHSWTRAQINVVSCQPNNNEQLIVASGKFNNGQEFEPFAIRLNPDTMIYERDESVDVSVWENEINGDTRPAITLEDLECVFDGGRKKLARHEALEQLKAATGLGKTACYNALSAKGKFRLHLSEHDDKLEFKP